MNKILSLSFLLLFFACSSEAIVKEQNLSTPIINQFQAVWNEIQSDKLKVLPQEKVSYFKLFSGLIDHISRDAKRTLSNKNDIIDYFDKLVHPNGVCLKGIWSIDKQNIYSGYFKKGSKALIIARASSALSETKRGETRSFGMAGKLFPTTDPQKINDSSSANFFLIDDLGATDTQYYTEVALTNEPNLSFTTTLLRYLAYGLKVSSTFRDADKNSGIRQLYEVSYLGEKANTTVITPKYLKIEAEKNQTRFGVEDFRDEFALSGGEKLVFNIFVSSSKKEWKRVGKIYFDSSVISTTCDHRLHFHHPFWRDDIVYE